MAEIHVQTKKNTTSPMWIWIVVVLLIAAALVYILSRNNRTERNDTINTNTTSYLTLSEQPATGFLPAA